ncbi:serine/threonine protein kinase [bacterium]|jgi:eukaryotic-like serine/threonine-protein kinase|nr:serine/threonine protein kinase [Planctomicrobium sp.]MDA7503973.1 serine/threonine protein kinase [bacterium]
MTQTAATEIPQKIGPFQLKEQIGEGGMGVVYRVEHEKEGTSFAIKIVNGKLTTNVAVNDRFEREIEILKKCQHPNIVRTIGTGAIHDQKFFIMEYVEKGSLATFLQKQKRLSWEQVVGCGIQIGRAMEYAHSKGIIHRDIKPANLLIDKEGHLKLTDFGIARDLHNSALTATGKTVGTLAYMAPEQITGKIGVSPRTDIYSLGCVLFEALTGQPPFSGENDAELLFKHIQEAPPSVSTLRPDAPVWLCKLIESMLEKDPSERPFDAPFLLMKLNQIPAKVKKQEKLLLKSTKDGASRLEKTFGRKQKQLKNSKLVAGINKDPFYEKPLFIVGCLVAVLLAVTFSIQHRRSEEFLYARAATLMQSSEPSSWARAEGDLLNLMERFPEGEHQAEIQLWLDQLAMHRAERKIETNARFGRDPQSEAERLYVEAQQFEKFGDRMTSLDKYEAMAQVLKNDDENRPFLNLARRQSSKIKKQIGTKSDRAEFVRNQIESATELMQNGHKLEGTRKLQAIVRLYGNHPEFADLTELAQAQLNSNMNVTDKN